MFRLLFVFLILIFIVDFSMRVFTVPKPPKEMQGEFETIAIFVHDSSDSVALNSDMFGKYIEESKVEEKKTLPPKKKGVEFKVELLAIYNKPQTHVLALLDSNGSASKFSMGSTLQGYTLVSVEKNTATFEKQGKLKELKVFK